MLVNSSSAVFFQFSVSVSCFGFKWFALSRDSLQLVICSVCLRVLHVSDKIARFARSIGCASCLPALWAWHSLLPAFAPLRAYRRSRVQRLIAGHHLSLSALPLVYARPSSARFAPRYPPCSAVYLIGSASLRLINAEASHSPSRAGVLCLLGSASLRPMKAEIARLGRARVQECATLVIVGASPAAGRPRGARPCLWGSGGPPCGSKKGR